MFGQQLVEVVSGHPPGEVGERVAHQLRRGVAQVPQAAVQPPGAVAAGAQRVEFGVGGGADGQPRAVGEQHVQRTHVVHGFAPGHRVRAAGVVADHAAEGAAAVRGGVGAEREAVRFRGGLQCVEHDARFHCGQFARGVDLEDPVEVPGEVQDQPGAAGVARDAGSRAPPGDRHAVFAGHGERGGHVVGVPRMHHAQRDLPVVRGVGGVQRAGAGVEARPSFEDAAQGGGDLGGFGLVRGGPVVGGGRHRGCS